MKDKGSQIGIIDTRECPHCGHHHEVGFVTRAGDFQALKPGTWVQCIEDPEELSSFPEMNSLLPEPDDQETDLKTIDFIVWLPHPLRSHKKLRLKYGVLIHKALSDPSISGELYQIAYMSKLRQLVLNTIHIPLPVILDRFFASPYLASGNPRQVTEVLWRELEEIRKPAILMQAWLAKPDEENLAKLIQPFTVPDLTGEDADDEQVRKELDELSIESFFELL